MTCPSEQGYTRDHPGRQRREFASARVSITVVFRHDMPQSERCYATLNREYNERTFNERQFSGDSHMTCGRILTTLTPFNPGEMRPYPKSRNTYPTK